MTKIKICGLRRLGDARLALELGASELGFVLAPPPRRVEAGLVRDLVGALRRDPALPPFRAVGVFVNESVDAMREIISSAGLDVAQIHGDEDVETCASFDFPWYRALRPSSPEEARSLAARGWNCPRILADAATRSAYGGTGQSLSPEIALAARDETWAREKEFFLAGGLRPDNVGRALLELRPDGIDLSSGVESAPGEKSADLLAALFVEVRRIDRLLAERREAADAAR